MTSSAVRMVRSTRTSFSSSPTTSASSKSPDSHPSRATTCSGSATTSFSAEWWSVSFMANHATARIAQLPNARALDSLQRLQLPDHPLQQRQPAAPERRVARVEAERREQLGMMLGAAGGEHREVAL